VSSAPSGPGVAFVFQIFGFFGGGAITAMNDDQARDDLDIFFIQIGPARDFADQPLDLSGIDCDTQVPGFRGLFQQVLQRLEHLLNRLYRVVEPLYRAGERPELKVQPLGGVGHGAPSP
jgi:hypothetical protein